MKPLIVCLVVVLFGTAGRAALAQTVPSFTLSCSDLSAPDKLQKQFCEVRSLTLPAPPAGTPLTIDARPGGGITVRGWNGPDVRVRALVEARAASATDAKALATAVQVSSSHHTLHAARANGATEGWSVSYEVLVPTQTSLNLQAQHGGIEVREVKGTITFTTVNGGVTLIGLGGEVKGKTTNGGLTLTLTGDTWADGALNVSTSNGSVTCLLPVSYSATLIARTVHGRVHAALAPGTRKSLLPHNLTATLGRGGPQLQMSTVNGSISVKQEGAGTPEEPGKQEEPSEDE